MSVILRGMKMPANCDVCPLDSGVDCMVYPPSAEIVYDIAGGKPAWCPLIEIPPHGDLIDRDALRKRFPTPKDWRCIDQALVHITGVWAEIDDTPIIIPAEEGEDG